MISKVSATNLKRPWYRIEVLNRQRRCKLFPGAVARHCGEILQELGYADFSLSVVFVSARRMHSMNRQYRGRDYATDVLSFSYYEDKSSALQGGNPDIHRRAPLQTARGNLEPPDRHTLSQRLAVNGIKEAPFLGDIVISPAVACSQAVRYGISPEKEIRKLLVHGILHLLGYDHETDNGQMNRLQARMVRRRAFARAAPITDIEN
jgi:probable rRNA maturation factor